MSTNHALFIIMNSGLASMNPGKGMAQASHATSLLHEIMYSYLDDYKEDTRERILYNHFEQWKDEADGFGTCLVFDTRGLESKTFQNSEEVLNHIYTTAMWHRDCHPYQTIYAEFVIDPTYPISDGQKTWLVEATTALVIFMDRDLFKRIFPELRLHP